MPRSPQPRHRSGSSRSRAGGRRPAGPGRADRLEELLGLDTGYSHQSGADGGWHVREVPAWRAVKDYTCPGCGRRIPQGLAHLVTWRSDWIMGDEDAGAERRHWHRLCWRTRASR